jgi:hypothetical protein
MDSNPLIGCVHQVAVVSLKCGCYLMNAANQRIRIHTNIKETWEIDNITGELYTALGHAARNFGAVSTDVTNTILANRPSDNLKLGTKGGRYDEVTFTSLNKPEYWGRVFVTFNSPTGEFKNYTQQIVFALPRLKMIGQATTSNWSYSIGTPYLNASGGHISNFTYNGTTYGLNNGRRMMETQANFGYPRNGVNPVVYSRGVQITNFEGGAYTHASLDSISRFDVVHFGYDKELNATQAANYRTYLDNGGVVIGMFDGWPIDVTNLCNAAFPGAKPAPTGHHRGAAGGMYQFMDIPDDMIINGPFGNLAGLHWGEDASETHWASNLPPDSVNIYTYACDKSDNVSLSEAGTGTSGGGVSTVSSGGATAWKHKRLNLFFLGDGGLTAIPLNSGELFGYRNCPFVLDPRTYFPTSKLFGRNSARLYQAYNAVFFANVMTWAMIEAAKNGNLKLPQ